MGKLKDKFRDYITNYVNTTLVDVLQIAYNQTLPHEETFEEWCQVIVSEYKTMKGVNKQ